MSSNSLILPVDEQVQGSITAALDPHPRTHSQPSQGAAIVGSDNLVVVKNLLTCNNNHIKNVIENLNPLQARQSGWLVS